MTKSSTAHRACPNQECVQHGVRDWGNIALHGFSKVKWGRRRRYRCTTCGNTFGATTGTPYKRIQGPKTKFDRVATLSVEGVSISGIARIEGLSWNTVSRWLEVAAEAARNWNNAMLKGYDLEELQLDELKTFLDSRNHQTWVFAGIEVSSCLWPATLVGSRSYRNTKSFVRDIANGSKRSGFPLITSDGMSFYASAIGLTFGVGCVHAQVIKQIKKNRVVKVGA
ncbi:MAG: hypothetical protein ACI8X5_003241, partial [Planctomycetota bacterium]